TKAMDATTSNERYARQMILPEIGAAGQARLARARVLVIGAGALGTPALYYLAAAGAGTLGIADDDRLELSNLHRQLLYRTEDIGRPKAATAAERLNAFNPDVRIETHPVRITADNAVELIARYDLTIDATDRLETKFLINDACAKAERPLVHAAILGFEARVAVFDARTGPCLRCLFPTPPDTPALTCSEAGVLGAVTGMAGSLQALEAIKWTLAADDKMSELQSLLGRLWLFDGRTLATRVVELPCDPACPVCRHRPESIRLAPTPVAVTRIKPAELAEHPEALLVDVREEEEWAGGHLEGAILRPLSRLLEAPPALPERDAYIVYCAHGPRSETAARIFTEAGYRNVYSLSGGLAAVTKEAT
ncbi:MAG: ThiF family adenylyltransferase, partial [Gammaproteobacteria bacterium]